MFPGAILSIVLASAVTSSTKAQIEELCSDDRTLSQCKLLLEQIAQENTSDSLEDWLAVAEGYDFIGEPESEIEALENAVSANPNSTEALGLLALRLRDRDIWESIFLAMRAAKAEPGVDWGHWVLADLLETLSRDEIEYKILESSRAQLEIVLASADTPFVNKIWISRTHYERVKRYVGEIKAAEFANYVKSSESWRSFVASNDDPLGRIWISCGKSFVELDGGEVCANAVESRPPVPDEQDPEAKGVYQMAMDNVSKSEPEFGARIYEILNEAGFKSRVP